MKSLWIVLLVLVILLMGGPAMAITGTASLGWTPPSAFSNGASLNPATDIDHYNVYCGATSGGPYTLNSVVSGGTSSTATITIPLGTTYCVITDVTTTVDGSLESAYSNQGSKTVTAPTGGACSGFTMK